MLVLPAPVGAHTCRRGIGRRYSDPTVQIRRYTPNCHEEVLVGAVRRLKNTALDAVEMSHAVERQLGPLVQAGNGH
eukprot:360971-Prorocentrum_minimum.AAC.1